MGNTNPPHRLVSFKKMRCRLDLSGAMSYWYRRAFPYQIALAVCAYNWMLVLLMRCRLFC
jgi:hypothetical protein